MNQRQATLNDFATITGFTGIRRLVQEGRDRATARYTIELDNGQRVRVGTIDNLWSQAELGKVVLVTLGINLQVVKASDWRPIIGALIVDATDVEEAADERYEETVREWIARYASRATNDRAAAAHGDAFHDNGDTYLTANELARYVRRNYSETVKLVELRQALKDLGFERVNVSYDKPSSNGHRTRSSTSYYRIDSTQLDHAGSSDQ
jgi:hypothetical protein